MKKIVTFAALGVAALALALATPGRSDAQQFGPRGNSGFYGNSRPSYGYGGYSQGYGYSGYRGYGTSGYGYGGYSGYGGYGYGYGFSRPVIVHPEFSHWTPYRGWHSHGHLHVPHWNHYHTIPY